MKFNKKYLQYNIVQCDPLPTQQELNAYYRDQYFQEGKGSYDVSYTNEEIKHKESESELIIHSILNATNNAITGKKLLELGCGEGFILSQANKVGFDILGVDYSIFGLQKWHPNLQKHFVQNDLYEFLDARDYKNMFDICVMKNVLEHVIDPSLLLNKIKLFLKPNGIVAITIPNDYSKVQNRLLKLGYATEEEWFGPPDHLHYFNTYNFTLYVKDLGFTVLDLYSSFPVDMFLFNKHSNYALEKHKGKGAHFARIQLDLLIKESGLQKALDLYRTMAQCGIGRDFTAILTY